MIKMKNIEEKKIIILGYIFLILFFLALIKNKFLYWKIYFITLILFIIFIILNKLFVISKNKRLSTIHNSEKIINRVLVPNAINPDEDDILRVGDLVEVLDKDNLESGANFSQGVISAINNNTASVQLKTEIKIIDVSNLKKIKSRELKFKDMFFLKSSLLEKLQKFNEQNNEKTKIVFFEKLKECVDFFRNGDFSDDYKEISYKFDEYENIEKYFSALKKLISEARNQLIVLKYDNFIVDLAIGVLFDDEGQKAIISASDALVLIKKYLKI